MNKRAVVIKKTQCIYAMHTFDRLNASAWDQVLHQAPHRCCYAAALQALGASDLPCCSASAGVAVTFQLSNGVRQLSAELRDAHIDSRCHAR